MVVYRIMKLSSSVSNLRPSWIIPGNSEVQYVYCAHEKIPIHMIFERRWSNRLQPKLNF